MSIIKEVIEREFTKRKIEYFISGSTRFGYDSPSSDLDVVIFDGGNYDLCGKLVAEFAGKIVSFPKYFSSLSEISILGGKVHIVAMGDLWQFTELKKEHEKVEAFLQKNKALVRFIKSAKEEIKSTGGLKRSSGTLIYNIIKDIMNDPQDFEEKPQDFEEKPTNQRMLRVKEDGGVQ
jgi:hypothetical protein